MKRLLLTAAALAAVAVPAISSAQPADVRRGEREVRQSERQVNREVDRALRDDGRIDRGERRDINEARRDLREDRRDLRDDRRDFRQDQRRADRWDRNNRDWWRGRAEFRGYNGGRQGYYFAPGYGYVRQDPRFVRHNWRRGEYVPVAYRRYAVADPYFYGLRAPPRGQQWVYVDNNIVLMSLATGLIAEVLGGIY